MNGKINADILITGSSRALTHYAPKIIENITGYSTFNIGINGSQTDMQLAMFKTYLDANKSPKLLIHNLDLFSFVTTKRIYNPCQYLPYLNKPHLYESILEIHPDAWKWKCLPLYGYVVEDLRFNWVYGLAANLNLFPKETHELGFLARHTPWTGEFEAFKAANSEGVIFEIEPNGVRDVEEIAEICSKRGIALIFVYSPVFHKMRDLEKNRDEIFAKFHEIAIKYKATLWDYSDSPISNDQANFYNSQHLNASGATLFSKELAMRLSTNAKIIK